MAARKKASKSNLNKSKSPRFINNRQLVNENDLEEGSKKILNNNIKNNSTGLFNHRDRSAMIILVILYLLQGVPTGLAFGSIPFLLKSKLSYSQIGVFSLSTYPYSLKLFWSPIVDAWFSPRIGRRKSWIIPVQVVVGLMMYWMSFWIEDSLNKVGLYYCIHSFVLYLLLLGNT